MEKEKIIVDENTVRKLEKLDIERVVAQEVYESFISMNGISSYENELEKELYKRLIDSRIKFEREKGHLEILYLDDFDLDSKEWFLNYSNFELTIKDKAVNCTCSKE